MRSRNEQQRGKNERDVERSSLSKVILVLKIRWHFRVSLFLPNLNRKETFVSVKYERQIVRLGGEELEKNNETVIKQLILLELLSSKPMWLSGRFPNPRSTCSNTLIGSILFAINCKKSALKRRK